NVVTWTTLIAGYAHTGHAHESLDAFHDMKINGQDPNPISFMSVLVACSHIGMVSLALHYFIQMVADYGLEPWREHYCTLIDILARSGQASRADDLVKNMPFEPDRVSWGALLGGCSRATNTNYIAALAAQNMLVLAPGDGAPYVLLANYSEE
ncbi:hypothetical protein SELMODRAFT_72101, partial [Selaginella moellendorffii]